MGALSIITASLLCFGMAIISIFLIEEHSASKREKQKPPLSYYTPEGLINELTLQNMQDEQS